MAVKVKEKVMAGSLWLVMMSILLSAKARGELIYRDAMLNGSELIRAYGYRGEEQHVITDDGYILCMFHLYNESKVNKDLLPLLLQHGMTGSGDDYLSNAGNSTAFYFADLGYDVWILNNRGTRYSSSHVRLSTDDAAFWNFSLEDLGTHDCRAAIDHVLRVTSHSQLLVIGHTEGNTQLLASFALDPDFFQRRVKAFMIWSPITNSEHLRAPMLRALGLLHINELLQWLGFKAFFPYFGRFNRFASGVCKALPICCYLGYRLFADVRPDLYELKASHVYMGHFPSGTSVKAMAHLGQMVRYKGFYRYQEDPRIPPVAYDLSRVQGVPLAILTGRHGGMSSYEDACWLNNTLNPRWLHKFVVYDDMADMTFQFHPPHVTAYLRETAAFLALHHQLHTH